MLQSCVNFLGDKEIDEIEKALKERIYFNYKARFQTSFSRKQFVAHDLHHLYPRNFELAFAAIGVDCHMPHNLLEIPIVIEAKMQERIKRGEVSREEVNKYVQKGRKNDRIYNPHQGSASVDNLGLHTQGFDWNQQWVDRFWQANGLWDAENNSVDMKRLLSVSIKDRYELHIQAVTLMNEMLVEANTHLITPSGEFLLGDGYNLSDFRGVAPYDEDPDNKKQVNYYIENNETFWEKKA